MTRLQQALRAIDNPQRAEHEALERKLSGYKHDMRECAVRICEYSARLTVAALDYRGVSVVTQIERIAIMTVSVQRFAVKLALMSGDVTVMEERLQEIGR